MPRTFVAINDPVHHLIRNVTRHTPLCAGTCGSEAVTLSYRVREQELPDAYYSLALLHAVGGMPLESLPLARWRAKPDDRATIPAQANYFDAVSLDKRCARDLRWKRRKYGPGMLTAELLACGTGMLRARNDDPGEPIHRYLWSHHGRIRTRHEVNYARIWALHRHSLPGIDAPGKESFDSTNVIYGDALGELEQLWDRRADTAFLDQVARSLQCLRQGQAEIAAFLHPPLNLAGVMQLHRRRQAVWRTPPRTGRALLRRLEFILDHTTIDSSPDTVFCWRELKPRAREAGGSALEAPIDRSGQDGWLTENPNEPPAPGATGA